MMRSIREVEAWLSPIGTFLSVRAKVLLQVAERGEEFGAAGAVEGFTVVEAEMGS
jgi:hypothetical protein